MRSGTATCIRCCSPVRLPATTNWSRFVTRQVFHRLNSTQIATNENGDAMTSWSQPTSWCWRSRSGITGNGPSAIATLATREQSQGEVTKARVKSRNRGQEKGIDVWLALDALVMCTREDLDCVIVASADSDLNMVRDYVRMVPGNETTKVIQARILNEHQDLRQSPAWDETVAIDRAVFDACRDDFDYDKPLDDIAVGQFLASIGSARDGMRD